LVAWRAARKYTEFGVERGVGGERHADLRAPASSSLRQERGRTHDLKKYGDTAGYEPTEQARKTERQSLPQVFQN